ncbi:6508_t:CDS:2, partial [Ambispora leptoticha]
FVKLATPKTPHSLPSPNYISTPLDSSRKRTPNSSRTYRLNVTPIRNRSGKSTISTNSNHTTSSSSILAFPHGVAINNFFKSTKRKSPKSIVRKEVLKLHVVEKDWIGGPAKTPIKKKFKSDRFIPNREIMDETSTQFNITHREPGTDQNINSTDLAYQSELARACGIAIDKRILAFNVNPPPKERADLAQNYNRPLRSSNEIYKSRRILKVPERVLDAPGMKDDYYLNLLDW